MKFAFKTLNTLNPASNLEDIMTEWNVNRVSYVAIMNLLLMGANFVNLFLREGGFLYSKEYTNIIAFAVSLILIVISRIYVGYIRGGYKKRQRSAVVAETIFMGFWILLVIGYTPFYIKDIAEGRPPFYLVIVYSLLITVPIFTKRQTITVFSIPALLNIFFAVVNDASLVFYIYTIVFSFFGFIGAFYVHQQFIALIMKLQYSGTTDTLTGLLNRQIGLQRGMQLHEICKRYNKYFALYMIDIDDFKLYNDGFGHINGDKALKTITGVFSTVFNRKEDVIYRYGGEEFTVCISSDSLNAIYDMAERTRSRVEMLNLETSDKAKYRSLTISIGCAICEPTEENKKLKLLDVTNKADQALFEAKDRGKNTVVINIL